MRPGEVSLAPEGSIQLGATLEDQYGQVMPGAAFAWASTDTAVVTVDSTGLAEALSNSRYDPDGGNRVPTGVIATSGAWGSGVVVSLAVEPFDANGHTVYRESQIYDSELRPVRGWPIQFEWESDNPAVVTMERHGVSDFYSPYYQDAVGLSEDTATITATALAEDVRGRTVSTGVSGSAEITVATRDPERPGSTRRKPPKCLWRSETFSTVQGLLDTAASGLPNAPSAFAEGSVNGCGSRPDVGLRTNDAGNLRTGVPCSGSAAVRSRVTAADSLGGPIWTGHSRSPPPLLRQRPPGWLGAPYGARASLPFGATLRGSPAGAGGGLCPL